VPPSVLTHGNGSHTWFSTWNVACTLPACNNALPVAIVSAFVFPISFYVAARPGPCGLPQFYGCAVHLADGSFHVAHFSDDSRGPPTLLPLRMSYLHLPRDPRCLPAHPIYDPRTGIVRVCAPCEWASATRVMISLPASVDIPAEDEPDAVGDAEAPADDEVSDDEGDLAVGGSGDEDDEENEGDFDEMPGADEVYKEQKSGNARPQAGGRSSGSLACVLTPVPPNAWRVFFALLAPVLPYFRVCLNPNLHVCAASSLAPNGPSPLVVQCPSSWDRARLRTSAGRPPSRAISFGTMPSCSG